jgi:hypothetical protein
MNYKNISWLLFLSFLITLSSCSKELERTNINPNDPENVDPEYLLNTSVFNTVKLFGGGMRREALSHYSNYVSVGGGQLPRYFTFAGTVNGYWQSAYVSCLQPVHQIVLNYSENRAYKNRVQIAKIFEAYIYSNIVAVWGSIPKTASLSGDVHIPYEKEEDIYKDLMNSLKIAADSIDLNGDTYIGNADAVYGGNLLKWKKFANTLRLRLAVRISNANPAEAQKVVADVLAEENNTILTQNETAHAFWGTTSDTWSYLYEYNVVQSASHLSSLNVISEALIQYMLPYNDPRLPVYAKPASQGPYKGRFWGQPKTTSLPAGVTISGGNPHSPLGQLDYSQIGDYFTKANEEFVFLSYEEACFLKAEAALKGWAGAKTAEQYYKEGITASMAKYSIPQQKINDYLATNGIAWNTSVDTTGRGPDFEDYIGITSSAILTPSPFKQIVMQEWLAGFYNAMDAWTLLRRSQVLDFAPHFNPDGGEGGAVGFAYIPQRLNYPGIEFQVNNQEVNNALKWLGGPDALRTRLWFAQPTNENSFLPKWR